MQPSHGNSGRFGPPQRCPLDGPGGLSAVTFGPQRDQGNAHQKRCAGERAYRGGSPVHLLGAVFAVLSAATFALTNATGRRGVISGTPAQGMVISIPVGLACFLAVALADGRCSRTSSAFTASALASLSAAGIIHFVIGRYCNFRASQAAGVNLTAPVMQLNAVVTLLLAVVVLREPCTMLQVAGGVLMVAGSLVTQRASQPTPAEKKRATSESVSAARCHGLLLCLDCGAHVRHVADHRSPGGPRRRTARRSCRRTGRLRGSDRAQCARAAHSLPCAAM